LEGIRCTVFSSTRASTKNLLSPASAAHSQVLYIQAQHPSILEHFDDFTSLLNGKRLAVFLDYDGTHF